MDLLRNSMVKARKPWKCFGCSRTRPAGETRRVVVVADVGSVVESQWCATCREWMAQSTDHDDEWWEGEIIEGDPEGWEAIRQRVEGTIRAPWTPRQVACLEARQGWEYMHEYTCECGHTLIPTPAGWECDECAYTQDWCHAPDASFVRPKNDPFATWHQHEETDDG